MGRRGDHSFKEINDMILNSAMEIVENEGYLKLSTRKIATQIGYTVGTLYNIFQNLDDIIIHLNGRVLDKLIAKMKSNLNKTKCNVETFKKLGLAYANFSAEHFNLWDMLVNYRVDPKTEIPKWYPKKIQELFDILESQLSKVVTNQSAEDLRDDITVMWSSIHGICILSIKGKFTHTQTHSKTEKLIENFIDNYFRGLGIKP